MPVPNKCEATKMYEGSNLARDFEHKEPNYLHLLVRILLGQKMIRRN